MGKIRQSLNAGDSLGDGVQRGFLPLVCSSLFLFMDLQSQISISMLEAKPLGIGGTILVQPVWDYCSFPSSHPSFPALARSKAPGFSLLGMQQAAAIPPACLKVDGQCHREG